jgi:hypothetical protein
MQKTGYLSPDQYFMGLGGAIKSFRSLQPDIARNNR